ncbi:MAG: TPM domain-containing protein [Candidatus Binatia bacterium]
MIRTRLPSPSRHRIVRTALLGFFGFLSLMPCSAPALKASLPGEGINDFAGMMPEVSAHEMDERLKRFKTQTGHAVSVLTVNGLDGESIEDFGGRMFESLPLRDTDLNKAVLLIVARKERRVGVQMGVDLRHLFPEPAASEKLQHHVDPYFDGMRPDLGIHAGVDYIFRVIKGNVRVTGMTEKEQLEEKSISGRGAGGIFSLLLAPYLAFMVGGLWGIYATNFGVQRGLRLFMGAVLGSGVAKAVAVVMSLMGSYSDGLWYFILAVSITLAVFGSLTEFWMLGEWSGIPTVKDPIKRKPEDNMGI